MLTRLHAEEIVALIKRFGGWDPNEFSELNRDPEEILGNPLKFDLISAFGPGGQWNEEKGGTFAPEEVFFATTLAILGYLKTDTEVHLLFGFFP
jgi:hypothetical protein